MSADVGTTNCQCYAIAAIIGGKCARCGKPVAIARQIADEAEALPRRAAHATYALMARWRDTDGSGPQTAAEICEYDDPVAAITVRHTAAALREAQNLGLVSNIGGYWIASERAWGMRRALEDRFLREVEQ